MCLLCHSAIGDENILSQLQGTLLDPRFEVWNRTSFRHLFIIAAGYNGSEAKRLALRLLDNYLSWVSETKPLVVPVDVDDVLRQLERFRIRDDVGRPPNGDTPRYLLYGAAFAAFAGFVGFVLPSATSMDFRFFG